MALQTQILEWAKKQKAFRVSGVLSFLKNAYSRQYIHRILKGLVKSGDIVRFGMTTNGTFYAHKNKMWFSEKIFRKTYINKGLQEHLVWEEIQRNCHFLAELKENVLNIATYAFSEMFNNAIEHSGSDKIRVTVKELSDAISITVEDYGVGVFKNVMKKAKLKNELEAMQELLKGKMTTDPKAHSGEGIFFTSKACDLYLLRSFAYDMRVDNEIKDVFFGKMGGRIRGTVVFMTIKKGKKESLNDFFVKYYSDPADIDFDKTEILVKLYAMGTVYISRSQARRILSRLEKFKKVILDFDKVPVVGQAFVDEIFRVYKQAHPEVLIVPVNMNEAVEFMVKRGMK